jgi:PmbA protein
MRDEELLASARQGVELAKAAGASDGFAVASRARSVEYRARDGKLERTTEATTRALALRVWVDGRFGAASTTDLRPDALAEFAADLVALTRALEPDPDRAIPDPSLYGATSADLDLVDPDVLALTREDRLALLQAAGSEVVGKDGVVSASAGVSDDHELQAAVASNGFEGTGERTALWVDVSVTLRDDGDKRPEDGKAVGARHRADVPDAAGVGRDALALARARLGAVPGPTRKTVMVVDPRASGRLIGALLNGADGASLQQGRSVWGALRGQPVLSRKLALWDDPLVPRGLASRAFDPEGLAARKLPLVEGGALVNAYVDVAYGRKLKEAPTTGTPSNRVVGLGTRDLAAILRDVPDGVYVTSWLGGNQNAATGDFSFGLRGHVVSNGQLGGPVGEMNVTGNVVELFARLQEVGSDPWRWSAVLSPTLVFDGVQFSGA